MTGTTMHGAAKCSTACTHLLLREGPLQHDVLSVPFQQLLKRGRGRSVPAGYGYVKFEHRPLEHCPWRELAHNKGQHVPQ
jgi:hypothetical protein